MAHTERKLSRASDAEAEMLLRGSAIRLRRKCGKAACHCRKGEPHATWALSYSVRGKTRILLLTVCVQPPWGGEPLGLPINLRLHRKGQATLLELAEEMVREVSGWFPDRTFALCADGFYAPLAGADLPRTSFTSRMRSDAALYRPAPPRRPRQRGAPPPSPSPSTPSSGSTTSASAAPKPPGSPFPGIPTKPPPRSPTPSPPFDAISGSNEYSFTSKNARSSTQLSTPSSTPSHAPHEHKADAGELPLDSQLKNAKIHTIDHWHILGEMAFSPYRHGG
jgi:hypothetical protein